MGTARLWWRGGVHAAELLQAYRCSNSELAASVLSCSSVDGRVTCLTDSRVSTRCSFSTETSVVPASSHVAARFALVLTLEEEALLRVEPPLMLLKDLLSLASVDPHLEGERVRGCESGRRARWKLVSCEFG